MPHLLNFLKSNGTVLSNIAHADDRAHRRRQPDDLHRPVRRPARPAGVELATRPTTRTGRPTRRRRSRTGRRRSSTPKTPARRPATTPTPSMVYSDHRAGQRRRPTADTPAPWVPFTRAGCTVGDFSTANMVLENAARRPPDRVRRRTRPRSPQTAADPDSFKDAEVADYVGEAVHCAQGAAICANAQAVKFGQTTRRPAPSPTRCRPNRAATPATRRCSAQSTSRPQLGGGTPNLVHNGYQVTDADGNLVDLERPPDQEPFSAHAGLPRLQPDRDADHSPTWPTCRSPASRSPTATSPTCTTEDRHHAAARRRPPPQARPSVRATPATSPNAARLRHTRSRRSSSGSPLTASRRPTPMFIIGAEENDQFAGANVGRATQPTPAGCDGVTVVVPLRERPDRRARGQHQGSALDDIAAAATPVRRRAAGRRDLRARAAGGQTTRPCASSSATPQR